MHEVGGVGSDEKIFKRTFDLGWKDPLTAARGAAMSLDGVGRLVGCRPKWFGGDGARGAAWVRRVDRSGALDLSSLVPAKPPRFLPRSSGSSTLGPELLSPTRATSSGLPGASGEAAIWEFRNVRHAASVHPEFAPSRSATLVGATHAHRRSAPGSGCSSRAGARGGCLWGRTCASVGGPDVSRVAPEVHSRRHGPPCGRQPAQLG